MWNPGDDNTVSSVWLREFHEIMVTIYAFYEILSMDRSVSRNPWYMVIQVYDKFHEFLGMVTWVLWDPGHGYVGFMESWSWLRGFYVLLGMVICIHSNITKTFMRQTDI